MANKSQPRLLLEALAERGPEGTWHYGLDLAKFETKIRRYVMYVHLVAMEEQGFVRSRYHEGDFDPRIGQRREYQITSRGRAALLRDDL